MEFDGWKERHWTLPFDGERCHCSAVHTHPRTHARSHAPPPHLPLAIARTHSPTHLPTDRPTYLSPIPNHRTHDLIWLVWLGSASFSSLQRSRQPMAKAMLSPCRIVTVASSHRQPMAEAMLSPGSAWRTRL